MTLIRKTLFVPSLLTVFSLTHLCGAAEESFDIVVYGATGGGVVAAVEAGRLGKSVALIEPQKFIGGMTAGGLGATDIGSKTTVVGLAKEFYHRMWKHYNDPANWTQETREQYKPKHHDAISENLEVQWFFEPKVADKILNGMLQEAGVKVFTSERLLRSEGGVKKEGNRISSVTMESGKVLGGKMFIDASYEGDLMAGAGVSHFIGREANSEHGETMNGIRRVRDYVDKRMDPYKVPGDPKSGILPNIESQPLPPDGTADKRVQAYTFRLCLTDAPENRAPITKPDNYDPLVFEPHLRWVQVNPGAMPGKLYYKLTPMPNRKTDSNNHGLFSTDFVGRSAEWAEASYQRRDELWKEHADYVRGFMWFLGNDPRVPEPIRKETLRWGLPKDEFKETGNWPFQLYVREARRMKSDYIVTEHDCRRTKLVEDGVVLASFGMDSHSTSRFVNEEGQLRGEGGFLSRVRPYPVSYRAIVPKEKECANLLVPVCLSATHAAYGSIRMEPVFMMLGQASAYAAAQAIDGSRSVQSVEVGKIRSRVGTNELVAGIKLASTDEEPVTKAEKLPANATEQDRFKAAVAWLKKSGAAKGDTAWLDGLKSGQTVDGEKVGALIIGVASLEKPAADVDAALDTLAADGTLPDAKQYWRGNARAGKTCKGQQVMQLCVRLWQQAGPE
ncbi:MAG TPA: FAD-dependent oxidoreductase [Luteolibacter sp.]|nr:FAD-dependent oxidoreductase [Luteolibacter sp.]